MSFKFLLWLLHWHNSCSGACCLVTTYLWFFQFSYCSWFLVCTTVAGKMIAMISIFLNLLKLVLCLHIYSIFENVPCTLEKCVFCIWMECSVQIQVHLAYVSFKATVSLFTFCLDDLSIDVIEVLKSPTTTVLLSISHYKSVNKCFKHVSSYVTCSYINIITMPSWWIVPFIMI